MKKRGVYIIQIALLLVMISGLITGCASLSSVPIPPASSYPADIIGRVTISKKLIVKGTEAKLLGSNLVWWIVETSVKNKEYQNPITSVPDKSMPLPKGVNFGEDWLILFKGKMWAGRALGSPLVAVPQGQSGNMIFLFELDENTNINDMQICYQGQEPFSYGKLIIGDTVTVYDWDLKKVTQTQTQVSQKNIATVGPLGMQIGTDAAGHALLFVDIKPNESALANKVYEVDLYEKGQLRAKTTVEWNQPEINVSTSKTVVFPVTGEEYNAYLFQDVSKIFSVKVHE